MANNPLDNHDNEEEYNFVIAARFLTSSFDILVIDNLYVLFFPMILF